MAFISENPLSSVYGDRIARAAMLGAYNGGDSFSGPGYNGVGDFTGPISKMVAGLLRAPNASQQQDQAAQAAYRDALTAKTNAETGDLNAAARGRSSIADIFLQAPHAAIAATAAPGTYGPLDGGYTSPDAAKADISSAPSRLAAAASYLPAGQQGDLWKNLLGATANTPGTSADAIGRAMVGAGEHLPPNSGVGGSLGQIFAAPVQTAEGGKTTMPSGQTIFGQPTESTAKATAFNALPPDQRALAVGPSDSQVKGNLLFNLSPADRRTAVLGAAGEQKPATVMVPGPDGKPMEVAASFNPATGQYEPARMPDGTLIGAAPDKAGSFQPVDVTGPGGKTMVGSFDKRSGDVKASDQEAAAKPGAAAAAFTPEALAYATQRYRLTGQLPPGWGTQGSIQRGQVIQSAAEQAAKEGATAATDIAGQSSLKADQSTLTQLEKTRGNIGQFEDTTAREINLVRQLAPKGTAGGVPVFNKWIQAGRTSVEGDADVSAFNVAIMSTKNEFARIMSTAGGGGNVPTTDAAKAEADALLSNVQTPQQLEAALQTMEKSMQNRIDAIDAEIGKTRGRISTAGTAPAAAAQTAPASASQPASAAAPVQPAPAPAAQQPPLNAVPLPKPIGEMTPDEMGKLDVSKLSDDQLRQLDARYNALKKSQ